MVKDIILSLKKLHNNGFSHGNLTPGNICAKQLKDSTFKFTLTGISNVSKLVKLGTENSGTGRGSIIFASLDSL